MENPQAHKDHNGRPVGRKADRAEHEILAELEALCTSPGYIHAVAVLCFRDTVMLYGDRLTEEDARELIDPNRLIRTEINTLLGFMIKAPIAWNRPSQETIAGYVDRSEALLEELHHALSSKFSLEKFIEANAQRKDPFDSGEFMREPIFYAAESAYNFQYLDLASKRYAADAEWLQEHIGFTVSQACSIAAAVDQFLSNRLTGFLASLRARPPEEWTLLPAFSFCATELAAYIDMDPEVVDRVLAQFAIPPENTNDQFAKLQDFNQITATPLIPAPSGEYISLQSYALAESIYDSPFYWMQSDASYRPHRNRHRGEFTENFIAERLGLVFGADSVSKNVEIWKGKDTVTEIDVLVLWADRAIIVQAKAKRLTIEARKGNERVIRQDFKESIQGAYDQGMKCAECISKEGYRFTDGDGSSVDVSKISQIFVFCAVSDHYPALTVQAAHFLRTRDVERVEAALVCDVFLIDVLTEMLSTPILFLSYISRRARLSDRILATNELTILAYHLKHSLWVDDSADMVHLTDEFTAGLDVAMAARRCGLEGDTTPDGLLTRFDGKALGRVFRAIERTPNPAVIDQGFQLIDLSGEAFDRLNDMVEKLAEQSAQAGQPRDMAMMFGSSSGLTIVCSEEPDGLVSQKLWLVCTLRKYRQRASDWFGLCLQSGSAELRFGIRLSGAWVHDDALEAEASKMKAPLDPNDAYRRVLRRGRGQEKTGRNAACPCGSGLKYKKCCLKK